MWKPGEIIVWKELYRDRVWHAVSTIVIEDTPQEVVLAIIPGADRLIEEHYPQGKNNGYRRWDFKDKDWSLEKHPWHTNRLLCILEPEKYYSTIYFWNNESNKFLYYYINFQLPFKRTQQSIKTLDLDLDLVINPDLSFEWKDLDDYQKGIEAGIILPQWVDEIETAKIEVLGRLERLEYPFDNSWLNWRPNLKWSLPQLPANWEEI